METYVWDVRNNVDDLSTYPQIQSIIDGFYHDEVIAIPTETVYGLAANAFESKAVDKIFKAKGRPSDNPLIVHIYSMDQLTFVETIHPDAKRLMEAFWPGPISFILPLKVGAIAENVTAGKETIAVRMPDHPIARQLLKLVNLPLAAPSANTSGRPSPTKGSHVAEDLSGKIYGIVVGDKSEVGLESTVLDCTSYPFKIARPGAITATMLNDVVPDSVVSAKYDEHAAPIAPGMKYRHYAPRSPMTLIDGGITEAMTFDDKTAVIAKNTERNLVAGGQFYQLCNDAEDIETASANLYDVLRSIDQNDEIQHIVISGFDRTERARAIMNRIDKAVKGD